MKPEAVVLKTQGASGTATSSNVVISDLDVTGYDVISFGAVAYNGTAAVTGKTVAIKVEARDSTSDTLVTAVDPEGAVKEIPSVTGQTTVLAVEASRGSLAGKLVTVTLDGDVGKADASYELIVLGLLPRTYPASDLQV